MPNYVRHVLNHAQNNVWASAGGLTRFYGGSNSLLQYFVILLKPYRLFSEIIDLFTFFIQSTLFANRVSPPAETQTLFCA